MLDEVIIHIGAPKTGTTTIQEFIALNHDILLDCGISVPNSSKNHQFLVSKFSNNPELLDFNKVMGRDETESIVWHDKCLNDSLVAAGDSSKLLFTSEHLVLLDESEINNLFQFFIKISKKLRIVVYVREPISWVRSGVQEAIKNGETTIEKALIKPSFIVFHELLDRWESVSKKENLVIRRFECENLLSDFVGALGLPEIDYQYPESNLNLSLSNNAMFIANELAKIAPKHSNQRSKQRRIDSLLSRVDGGKFEFPFPFGSRISNIVANDTKVLNEKYSFDYKFENENENENENLLYDVSFVKSLALILNEAAKS